MRQILAEDGHQERGSTGKITLSYPVSRNDCLLSRGVSLFPNSVKLSLLAEEEKLVKMAKRSLLSSEFCHSCYYWQLEDKHGWLWIANSIITKKPRMSNWTEPCAVSVCCVLSSTQPSSTQIHQSNIFVLNRKQVMKRFLPHHPKEALLSADVFHHLLHQVHCSPPCTCTTLKYRQSSTGRINAHVQCAALSPLACTMITWKIDEIVTAQYCLQRLCTYLKHKLCKPHLHQQQGNSVIIPALLQLLVSWSTSCCGDTNAWHTFLVCCHFPDLLLMLQTSPVTHPTLQFPAPLPNQTQPARGAPPGCTIELKLEGTRSWLSGTNKDHGVVENYLGHCIVIFFLAFLIHVMHDTSIFFHLCFVWNRTVLSVKPFCSQPGLLQTQSLCAHAVSSSCCWTLSAYKLLLRYIARRMEFSKSKHIE